MVPLERLSDLLMSNRSIRSFCDMLAGDDYQQINEQHRLKASIFIEGQTVF